MSEFKIQHPNDYASAEHMASAVGECLGGDAECDNFEPIFDALSTPAAAAGLVYVRDCDYGAIWTGSDEQFAACVAALPGWAQRYASKIEPRE